MDRIKYYTLDCKGQVQTYCCDLNSKGQVQTYCCDLNSKGQVQAYCCDLNSKGQVQTYCGDLKIYLAAASHSPYRWQRIKTSHYDFLTKMRFLRKFISDAMSMACTKIQMQSLLTWQK